MVLKYYGGSYGTTLENKEMVCQPLVLPARSDEGLQICAQDQDP
jgi:hypothetical protein